MLSLLDGIFFIKKFGDNSKSSIFALTKNKQWFVD